MHKLEHTFVLGTNIMFYEINMVEEYLRSIRLALEQVENPFNVLIHLGLNFNEYFETIDTDKKELKSKFLFLIDSQLSDFRYAVKFIGNSEYLSETPYTMVNYRRELNDKYCNYFDYIIWGETDCFVPTKIFPILDKLMVEAHKQSVYRYITTFATRKMWDDSWRVLEHPEFVSKEYYERDDPRSQTEPHSIRYTMSIEEMEEINNRYYDSIDIQTITEPKFDGSILCISSELIKAGANIPPGFWGLSAEDTAFMYSCLNVFKGNYIQFVIKNILKVHNREHPDKRTYARSRFTKELSTQREKGEWYNVLRELNKHNFNIIFNPNFVNNRLLTVKDFENRWDTHCQNIIKD